MKPRFYSSDYDGYTTIEACRILGKSKMNLRKLGIYKRMMDEPGGHSYPFAKSIPVFTTELVERWRVALLRHQGWIAMLITSPEYPQRHSAIDIPMRLAIDLPFTFDCVCNNCGSFAIGNPLMIRDGAVCDPFPEELTKLNNEWPQRIWCSKCGLRTLR